MILPVKTSVDKELLKDIFVVQLTDKNNCDLIEYDLPGLCIDGRVNIIISFCDPETIKIWSSPISFTKS